MTALRHLVHLCGGTWFRRLLGVRLASQLSDGVLQAALASYALFGQDQATAAEIATALAVVLLPFSLLGPFAGVFLDRWSRRQVLVLANLVRVAIALVLAGVVAAGLPDPVFYGVVLLCLSVNRFLLAGLSASLPHTVAPDDLLTANALTPTAGTLAFLVGLGTGGLVRVVTGAGDVAVLVTAALLYGVAGLLALRIPRDLLGPDPGAGRPAPDRLGAPRRHRTRRRPASPGRPTRPRGGAGAHRRPALPLRHHRRAAACCCSATACTPTTPTPPSRPWGAPRSSAAPASWSRRC